MKKNKSRSQYNGLLIMATVFLLCLFQGIANAQTYIVIWYHNIDRDSIASLKTALSSGLINHVMIKTLSSKDYNWTTREDIYQAIQLTKAYNSKVIWSHPMWPLYNIQTSHKSDLFDPNYYIREIRTIREEAAVIGAEYVGLDMESYASSPLKQYLGPDRNNLTVEERNKLKSTINAVVKVVGKLDFVLPAGSGDPLHPYNQLAGLGNQTVAESTYWDVGRHLSQIRYEYSIFGAYVNTTAAHENRSDLSYYTIESLFAKEYRWSMRKGIMIYPKEHKSFEIAKALVEYAKKHPVKN